MKKKNDLRDRLFRVTSDIRKPKEDKPIPTLEQWEYEPNSYDKRKYPRKDVPVYGIFETENSQFRALTKNVSTGGVLVDFEAQLSFHEHINITFIHRNFYAPVRTNGKVVRLDSDGIGIQFNKVVPILSSL